MNIQIRTKQGEVTKEGINSALEKADLSESLAEKFADDGVDLDIAIVAYDNGVIQEFTDIDSLIQELGKFGL